MFLALKRLFSPFSIAWGRMPVPFRWGRPKNDMDVVRAAIARHYNPHWNSGKWRHVSNVMYFFMLLMWPIRAVLMIAGQTRKYGAKAQETAGLSLGRQLVDQFLIAYKYNCNPQIYYLFLLFDKGSLQSSKYYLLNDTIFSIVGVLNHYEPDDAVEDKLVFGEKLREAGVPVVPDISIFERGVARNLDGSGVLLPESDFVVKPRKGLQGQGLLRFELEAAGIYTSSDGSAYDKSELYRHLCQASLRVDLLIQPRVRNHRLIAHLSLKGFSTARIITGLNISGNAEVLIAVFKMQTGDGVADNFAAGGIASPVCLESGELGLATSKQVLDEPISIHPSTGEAIPGTMLPHWQEVKAAVMRAHLELAQFKLLAWDVGISDSGPIIIEANRDMDIVLSQKPGSRAIGSTRFAELTREWLEAQ